MSQWQSIDTAPEDGSDILVFRSHPRSKHRQVVACFNKRLGWVIAGSTVAIASVIHWMPLPEPPEPTP